MACCSITDLKSKEVISAKSGCRLGFVNDVELDMVEGKLTAIIIWGKGKFGLWAHECDLRICWSDIAVIGDDTILVHAELPPRPPKPPKKGGLSGMFQY